MNVKPRKPKQCEEKSSNWKTEGSATSPWQRLGRQSERLLPVEPTWSQARESKSCLLYVRQYKSNLKLCILRIHEAMKSIQVPKLLQLQQLRFTQEKGNHCATVRWCAILRSASRHPHQRSTTHHTALVPPRPHNEPMNPFRSRLNSKTNWVVMYLPSLASSFSQWIPNATCLKLGCCGYPEKLVLLWATDFMMSNIACKCWCTCTSDLAR